MPTYNIRWALLALSFFILGFACDARAGDVAFPGYDHVMQTQTLRCGYNSIPPYIKVDAATKAISGPIYEIANAVAKRLNLKIEWTQESGYGEIVAGLESGKFDAFCGLLWQTPARAAVMAFTEPLYKTKVYPCVRAQDAYDKSSDSLNAPDKTFAGYDGDVSLHLAQELFPNAKTVSVPANMSFAEILQGIVAKKYDAIATCGPVTVDAFNKANGRALKIAAPEKPITVVPVVFAVQNRDQRLKAMMNAALYEMVADGSLERIMRGSLDKYIDNTIILTKPY